MIENIPTDGLYNEQYTKIMDDIDNIRSMHFKHGLGMSMAGTGSWTYSIFDLILSPFKKNKKTSLIVTYFLKKLKNYLIKKRKIQISYVDYVWTKDVILSSTFPYPVRRTEYPWSIINADLKKPVKILDVGSGVSMLPIYLASKGHEVYSIDSDIGVMERICPKLAEWCNTKVNYSVGNVTKINFNDNTFDRVFCVSVLEHLEEEVGNIHQKEFHNKNLDVTAVKEMLRVLKPGGLLILTLDWSENTNDYRSYKLDDIYNRLLKDFRNNLVIDSYPKLNWENLKNKHLEAEKSFPPYNYLVEGWAMGVVLKK